MISKKTLGSKLPSIFNREVSRQGDAGPEGPEIGVSPIYIYIKQILILLRVIYQLGYAKYSYQIDNLF